MIKGKIQKISYDDYRTLNPNLTVPNFHTCGGAALQCLTGHSEKRIMKFNKGRDIWPDRVMLKYLRKYGFVVIPITLGTMVHAHDNGKSHRYEIKEDHVLLISQHMYNGVGTWAVLHNWKYYHSHGEPGMLTPTEFINNPIDTAYVVWHKKWIHTHELPFTTRSKYHNRNDDIRDMIMYGMEGNYSLEWKEKK